MSTVTTPRPTKRAQPTTQAQPATRQAAKRAQPATRQAAKRARPATRQAAKRAQPVRTRRIEFVYPAGEVTRHFAGGDLVTSHVLSVLSSLFPEGEDFFVRSVRHYRDRIGDPELKAQVGGFIGQEAMHGREHRRFNERLQGLGYPTERFDRWTGAALRFGERHLPEDVQLAITAALEHYTATLAELLLRDSQARVALQTDEVHSLLLWHALEESEHKAVAFDVFQAMSGDQRMRARVMNVVTAGFLLTLVGFTVRSMLADPSTRDLRRLGGSLRRVGRSPFLSRAVRARIRDYNRYDFHPNDHDSIELLAEWRSRLFGDDGMLASRLNDSA